MATVTEVLQRLEGFPQDLASSLEIGPNVDTAELIASLDSVAHLNPEPEARNCIVQVAAKLPSSRVLEDTELLWAQDAGPSVPAVTKHIVAAIDDGTFDKRKWVLAAAKSDSLRSRDVAVTWGREHFSDLLAICKDEFADPALRAGVLTVIQSIVLAVPYSPETPIAQTLMYQLARDDFFPLVLDSLLFDTNHQLFVLALSVLVTVLPFALQVLITRVPLLMVVLGRAISWRDRPFIDAGRPAMSGATFTPLPNPSHNWVIATSTTHQKDPHSSGDMTASSPIEKRIVQLLLIALYGAWPSNVLAFTRDAPRYLDLKDVEPVYAIPWDDVWEQDQLAGKLLPLIADFQLHPSIITHTSLGELQDLKRWEKYDPSEFVSMCHLLSHSTEDDMFDFFKVPQVQLDPQPAVTAVDAETGVAATDDIGRLKEENELLRLEALYTERLRKQLVYHIGRLHRNSLRFNSDEAEIHTFVNRLKEQAKSISTLTAELSQQRTEASQAQQKHVKWQKELRDKVSGFREERRNWQTEASTLRSDLSEAHQNLAKQRDELADVKNQRFVLQSQLLEATPKLQHIADFESRIQQLTDSQLLWDSDVQKMRDAISLAQAVQSRCFELEGMIQARDNICREQAEMIQHLENRVVIATSVPPTPPVFERPPTQPEAADASFYINVAENARKRAERLERENLELNVEVERLRRMSIANAATDASRSLLFGEG